MCAQQCGVKPVQLLLQIGATRLAYIQAVRQEGDQLRAVACLGVLDI
jgi:hypothetical protein